MIILLQNILFKKEILECTGYILGYLQNLSSGLGLVSGTQFQHIFKRKFSLYVMRYAIWYHLYNLKINTPPWMFFTFFNLYKCYQIVQRTTYDTFSTDQVAVSDLLYFSRNQTIRVFKFLLKLQSHVRIFSRKSVRKGERSFILLRYVKV